MYINKVFNVGCAWEMLRENNATELSELQVALANLGYVDSIKEMKDGVLSNLSDMEWRCRNYAFGVRASFKEFKAAPSKPNMIQMGALKSEVAIDIGMNIPTSLDSWVTFRSKSASSLGLIPVLIMPLDVGKDSSFRMSFDYVVQRIQYLDIVEGNSFLILGCSYDYSDIEVIDSDKVIRRTITFEPHQIQAGVGLLSYFSEVLKQRCSEANSKVSIEQDGEKVRLRIKSAAGTEHKVEALLNEYGEVLNGTRQPEQLMTDQVQLLSLQNKLDMAAMEVKHQQSILALTKSNYDQRIFSLEEQVADLKHMISESITSHRIAQDQGKRP